MSVGAALELALARCKTLSPPSWEVPYHWQEVYVWLGWSLGRYLNLIDAGPQGMWPPTPTLRHHGLDLASHLGRLVG